MYLGGDDQIESKSTCVSAHHIATLQPLVPLVDVLVSIDSSIDFPAIQSRMIVGKYFQKRYTPFASHCTLIHSSQTASKYPRNIDWLELRSLLMMKTKKSSVINVDIATQTLPLHEETSSLLCFPCTLDGLDRGNRYTRKYCTTRPVKGCYSEGAAAAATSSSSSSSSQSSSSLSSFSSSTCETRLVKTEAAINFSPSFSSACELITSASICATDSTTLPSTSPVEHNIDDDYVPKTPRIQDNDLEDGCQQEGKTTLESELVFTTADFRDDHDSNLHFHIGDKYKNNDYTLKNHPLSSTHPPRVDEKRWTPLRAESKSMLQELLVRFDKEQISFYDFTTIREAIISCGSLLTTSTNSSCCSSASSVSLSSFEDDSKYQGKLEAVLCATSPAHRF